MESKRKYLYHPARNPVYLADHSPSEYLTPHIDLNFNIASTAKVTVTAELRVMRNPALRDVGGPLILDGEGMALKKLAVQEPGRKPRPLSPHEYLVTDKHLIIKRPPDTDFTLRTEVELNPKANTRLEGLYLAGDDVLISQCEAQGFRRITYSIDRPDNPMRFTVTAEANKKDYPVIISNGEGGMDDAYPKGRGRHVVPFEDQIPKPTYIFGIVAGKLKLVKDVFQRQDGKETKLCLAVPPGYENRVDFAMQAVKNAMAWDERTHGYDYSYSSYYVVGVEKFNSLAMENRGIPFYNISCLAGDFETMTDDELLEIDATVAHEYFHEKTGNAVTIRTWFDLGGAKEGPTVLRERQYMSDMYSPAIRTLRDVQYMRTALFPEETGPMAHAAWPDYAEEFNNIYSATVYQKSAYIWDMVKTTVGDDKWYEGMTEYCRRFEGQAVTTGMIMDLHEEISGQNLSPFRTWFTQVGMPEVSYEGQYDEKKKTYTLTFTQRTPATRGQPEEEKKPLLIPIRTGLISKDTGKDIFPTRVLPLEQEKQSFVFENVTGPVVPSVLRGFLPVRLMTQAPDDELAFRMVHDSDPYNKYEAGKEYMAKTLLRVMDELQAGKIPKLGEEFVDSYRLVLSGALEGDRWFNAYMMTLPAHAEVAGKLETYDPHLVESAIDIMRTKLAVACMPELSRIYAETKTPEGEVTALTPEQIGRRALHNAALSIMSGMKSPNVIRQVKEQYDSATNMTERYGALETLTRICAPEADAAFDDFYKRYKDDGVVINKWLELKASIPHGDAAARVQELMKDKVYDETNPDRFFAVLRFGLGKNPRLFHKEDGSGYKLVADTVIRMNAVNPYIAASTARRFFMPARLVEPYRGLMTAELKRIVKETPDMDAGLKEVVGNALESVKTLPKSPKGSLSSVRVA